MTSMIPFLGDSNERNVQFCSLVFLLSVAKLIKLNSCQFKKHKYFKVNTQVFMIKTSLFDKKTTRDKPESMEIAHILTCNIDLFNLHVNNH